MLVRSPAALTDRNKSGKRVSGPDPPPTPTAWAICVQDAPVFRRPTMRNGSAVILGGRPVLGVRVFLFKLVSFLLSIPLVNF